METGKTAPDYKALQEWLDGLTGIPQHQTRQRTLMDITGITHHENMWSDIYKFFFTTKEEHGLTDLFIRSLEQLLDKKRPHSLDRLPFLETFTVKREYVAEDNKRIDLLLLDKEQKRAIIIENKVFHTLDNDLNLYQRSVRKKPHCDSVKVVVLGLKHYDLKSFRTEGISAEDLFTITHKELLDSVMARLPAYMSKADPRYLYLLQEFYKNINNYTNMIDPAMLAFFCKGDNKAKVVQVHRVYRDIADYITNVMTGRGEESAELKEQLARQQMEPLVVDHHVKYIFPHCKKEVMLTVWYRDTILYPEDGHPHVHIYLEVLGDVKKKVLRDKEAFCKLIPEGARPLKDGPYFAEQIIDLDNLEKYLPILAEKMAKEAIAPEAPLIMLGKSIIKKVSNEALT